MRHSIVFPRTSAPLLPCEPKRRVPVFVHSPVELRIANRKCCYDPHLNIKPPLKRYVPLLHAGGYFGVKMSDKLLTFSRHKNKTLNMATLGAASWQEEHQVLAIPTNQRTWRSVTVLLSAVWRVFESRLGHYLSNSLVGVVKKLDGVARDSERFLPVV